MVVVSTSSTHDEARPTTTGSTDDNEPVDKVEVVVAHDERTTLRVGDLFLKVDADPDRLDHEARALSVAPVPTPEVLWRQPSVLALAALVRARPARASWYARPGSRSPTQPARQARRGEAPETTHPTARTAIDATSWSSSSDDSEVSATTMACLVATSPPAHAAALPGLLMPASSLRSA